MVQVATHVIGDGAIEKTIDSYEKTFGEEGNKLRHTLVHCQITDKALLERIEIRNSCKLPTDIPWLRYAHSWKKMW